MRWVACDAAPDLLGSREGHCAAVIAVRGASGDDDEAVIVVGGYGEGALCADAIAAPLATLPRLCWSMPAVACDDDGGDAGCDASVLECDGASLTRVRGDVALLFGGLDAQYERRNAVYALRLVAAVTTAQSHDAWQLRVRALAVSGDVPAPRSRHAAGATYDDDDDARLFVFGGDTDAAAQTDDLYALSLATCVWRRVVALPSSSSPRPSPRLCCASLPLITRDRAVLYGGARFADGGDVTSCDDVWLLDLRRGAWSPLPTTPRFARSNGHCGVQLRRRRGDSDDDDAAAVVFVGGKDVAEGCDDVRVLTRHRDGGVTARVVSADAEAEDDESGGERNAPHWRYAAAAVAVAGGGVLLLGGQCRHPQRVAAYLLLTADA